MPTGGLKETTKKVCILNNKTQPTNPQTHTLPLIMGNIMLDEAWLDSNFCKIACTRLQCHSQRNLIFYH